MKTVHSDLTASHYKCLGWSFSSQRNYNALILIHLSRLPMQKRAAGRNFRQAPLGAKQHFRSMETLTFDTFREVLMRVELGKHRPRNCSDTPAITVAMFCTQQQPQFHLRINRVPSDSTTDPAHERKLTATEKHNPDLTYCILRRADPRSA